MLRGVVRLTHWILRAWLAEWQSDLSSDNFAMAATNDIPSEFVADSVDKIREGLNAVDSMYRRISREPNGVSLSEVCFAARLFIGNQWMQPNYAANQLYKLLSSLGRDTTGMAGF